MDIDKINRELAKAGADVEDELDDIDAEALSFDDMLRSRWYDDKPECASCRYTPGSARRQ